MKRMIDGVTTMSRPVPHLATVFLVLALAGTAFAVPQETEAPTAAVTELLDEILRNERDPRGRAVELWRAAVIPHGKIDPVLAELERREARDGIPVENRIAIQRLRARLIRMRGDLRDARKILEAIEASRRSDADWLGLAEVLDAMGEDEKAITAYDQLLEKDIDAALRNRILLRKALMEGAQTEKKDEKSPLARFAASDGVTRDLRNQAAIILALTDRQKEALELFEVHGEGTVRYRQLVRLAEWGIEAELWKEAQDFAWQAVGAAAMKRDRRYALTILVEAYRRGEALEELIARFGKEEDPTPEARRVWIDLLRETGNVEQALELFKDSHAGKFTVDMRRELLEICREASDEKTLVATYRRLIEEEPKFLEWREGLARFYLERGDRETAIELWRPYLEVTREPTYVLAAAATLMGLGLDETALEFAKSCRDDEFTTNTAMMFQFELHLERGRHEEARKTLGELERLSPEESAVRKDVAEAYERLGDKRRAAEVLAALREARGAGANPDSEMKLALLYSEIDDEDRALDLWYELWRKIDSIPRRRYVEDRLMTVASRLGKLAKIAVRLEKKLAAGEADDRDAGLLVRLYTRVKDAVSATEIIEEHMGSSGAKPVDVLSEKARIFLSCHDYFNYEKVVKELIRIDPEGRGDYLRQLAMSNLERGQRDDARVILEQLKGTEGDGASDEFEAGVLAIAGMREEALEAYRRGVARHPERIDTYLLLSNVQKELGRHDRSAGMFQFLASTAEKDDLFTIAIDGILNMRDGRANRGAPDRLVKWARRVTLERLARRSHKLYLYQLVSDLAAEVKDHDMARRALKSGLPVAGEQRTPLLRELMSMAKNKGRNPSMGVIIVMGPGGATRAKQTTVNTEQLMYGRRLLGQGELVPPQVYLDLGEAFLDAAEVKNATRTFNQAARLPEFGEMQSKIAQLFEAAAYPKEALRVYERLLTVKTTDVPLLTKVAELQEQLGRDDVARDLYGKAMEILLDRSPFSTTKAVERQEPQNLGPGVIFMGPGKRNTDDYDRHHDWVTRGLLATLDAEEAGALLAAQKRELDGALARAGREVPEEEERVLGRFPRLERRAALIRRCSIAFDDIAGADEVDRRLLEVFARDESLLEHLVRFRIRWGYVSSARALIRASDRPEEEKEKLRLLTGGGSAEVPGMITVAEATTLLLPLLVADRTKTAQTLLERLDLSTGEKSDIEKMPLLVGAAVYLGQSEAALGLCRHWLNLLAQHSAGTMYGAVEGVLAQGRMALDKDQQRSLIEYLVDKVVENPDKFSVFIQRLPDLQKKIGDDLIGREQVEKLIRGRLEASDRFIYGIPQLFVLLPSEDRGSVLRSVWAKVPKTQKALFLILLLPQLDKKVEPGFADFLAGSFATGLDEADDLTMMKYYVDDMVSGAGKNPEVVVRFLEALRKKNDREPVYTSGWAVMLSKAGRKKEAIDAAGEFFKSVIGANANDYYVRSAIDRVVTEFGDDYVSQLLAVLDEYEKKHGPSVEAASRRLDLVEKQDDTKRFEATLRSAIEKHPEEMKFRTRLRRYLDARQRVADAASVQKGILEVDPKKKNERTRLESYWKRLRNPIAALAVRKDGEESAKRNSEAKKADESQRVERTPPANVGAIKKALDEKRSDDARTLYRRLWRIFPDRSNPYYRYSYQSRQTYRHMWPVTPVEKKDNAAEKKKPVKRYRGGLPEAFTKAPEEKDENKEAAKPPQRQPVTKVLIDQEWGPDEVTRLLRSLDSHQLDGVFASDVFEALAAVEVEKSGDPQTVVERLLASESAGGAGKVTYGLLFSLLEEAKGQESVLSSTLEGLIKNINAQDTGQLRRLARLHAKSGEVDKAVALYRWCAIMQGRSGFGFYNVATDLLDEVMKNLDGEPRQRAVETILDFGDPGEESYWGRDQYLRMVLNTWEKLLGPEKALERSRGACAKVLDMSSTPSRNAARVAAYLHAHAGEIETALRCLEIAVCKLEVPDDLRYPWYRSYYENPGILGTNDLMRLFPKDTSKWKEPDAWLRAAAAKIEEWAAKKRLRENGEFRVLAVLALRLHEAGERDDAVRILGKIRELAGEHPANALWVADVARLLGDDETAHGIELDLLGRRSLNVERVPEVVARVLEARGAERALELGRAAATWTAHPDLLSTLEEACRRSDDEAGAKAWSEMKKEAEAAEEALKPKKKPGEGTR